MSAIMQHQNWNDYRHLLAVKRFGSISEAARNLGVSDTTVSRRIKTLQGSLGVQLIERLVDGTYHLTATGIEAALRAEAIDSDLSEFQSQVSGLEVKAEGNIRLSAVPMLINRLITINAPDFLKRYPGLVLELNPDIRNLSLTKRETDMAIRLARPQDGGSRIKTRKIGTLKHAIYAARTVPEEKLCDLPFVTHQEPLQHLPQAKWMAAEVKRNGGSFYALRAGDAEGVIECVAAGVARSVLPEIIGEADHRLKRTGNTGAKPDFEREVWLLIHADLANLTRLKIVGDWLFEMFNKPGPGAS